MNGVYLKKNESNQNYFINLFKNKFQIFAFLMNISYNTISINTRKF